VKKSQKPLVTTFSVLMHEKF